MENRYYILIEAYQHYILKSIIKESSLTTLMIKRNKIFRKWLRFSSQKIVPVFRMCTQPTVRHFGGWWEWNKLVLYWARKSSKTPPRGGVVVTNAKVSSVSVGNPDKNHRATQNCCVEYRCDKCKNSKCFAEKYFASYSS